MWKATFSRHLVFKSFHLNYSSKPKIASLQQDLIGPADPISNLRPILRHQPKNETKLEKKLRLKFNETETWNHEFWAKHNSVFFKEREAFIKANLSSEGDKKTLSADRMSVFYKQFLDKNWKTHLTYNIEWYKRNFSLLILSTKVNIMKLFAIKKN